MFRLFCHKLAEMKIVRFHHRCGDQILIEFEIPYGGCKSIGYPFCRRSSATLDCLSWTGAIRALCGNLKKLHHDLQIYVQLIVNLYSNYIYDIMIMYEITDWIILAILRVGDMMKSR